MRDGVEETVPASADRSRRGNHGAVPMLHAIAIRVREIVGQECIGPWFVDRILAVDRTLLADDFLHVLDERFELCGGAGVMCGETKRPAVDLELTDRHRTELRGAVHQILKVRRRKLEGGRARMQLRRHLPMETRGRNKGQCRWPVVQSARPHDRRRHVDVRMASVHGQVGAVHAIAEYLVAQRQGAAVLVHRPSIWVGPFRRQLASVSAHNLDVVDIYREVVQRVAPRRGTAHAQFEWLGTEIGEPRFDLHPMMLGFGKGEAIGDW